MTLRRNGTGRIRDGAKTIDNTDVSSKVYLREVATSGLDELHVLDCFAGEGVLWSNFDCATYVGIERERTKNPKVINGDNMSVIPKQDLSKYNVIDLDSYGIPANQIRAIYQNGTLKRGTVIIYTCISNKVSQMSKALQEYAGIERKTYEKAETLFNGFQDGIFFDFLASLGIDKVYEFVDDVHVTGGYTKRYGYFIA